jgi:hypothetical protein
MKSILLNGRKKLSAKRLVKIDDDNQDEDETNEHDTIMNDSIEEEDDDFHLVKKNSNSVSKIKYIDDYDTDSIKSLVNLINKTNNIKVESLSHRIHVEQYQTNELTFKENSKEFILFYFIFKNSN